MDYNTQRKNLIFPEYGRNIQKMVDICKKIEDREERIRTANAIVAIMGNLHPHLRDVPDFKHKLWNHLALMADFDLDIDWPYKTPDREELAKRPDPMPYSSKNTRHRHYGRNIDSMLAKINDLETEEEKAALIQLLANHMKKLVATWKKEYVEDEVIFKDIEKLTKGDVVPDKTLVLNNAWDMNAHLNTSKPTRKKKNYRKR